MKNWEKYLVESNYNWIDMFRLLIDEGHMHNMIKKMIQGGNLDELTPDEFDNLVQYLDDKMRVY